jgi:NAD(P)H-hydrate repair Nnr-like enzyme with NAD(P)H-hydrate epimerase domain
MAVVVGGGGGGGDAVVTTLLLCRGKSVQQLGAMPADLAS